MKIDIIDTLTGFMEGLEKVQRATGMTRAEIREYALNHNVEQCPTCHWWVESSERIPDGQDEPDRYCENCRPAGD